MNESHHTIPFWQGANGRCRPFHCLACFVQEARQTTVTISEVYLEALRLQDLAQACYL